MIAKRVHNALFEVQKSQELGIYTEIVNDTLDLAYEKLLVYLREYYPELKW